MGARYTQLISVAIALAIPPLRADQMKGYQESTSQFQRLTATAS